MKVLYKMLNVNFIEFITKHENFYNSLSEENKKLISDLDTYKALELYSDKNFYTYLYIGIKGKMNYLYKCSLKYNPNTYYMCVSDGKVIKIKNLLKLTYINYYINYNLFKEIDK